jgi:hypothetical protein
VDFVVDDLTEINGDYYNVESFNDIRQLNNSNSLFIMHQNIRSFNKNIDEFLLYIAQLDRRIDMLVLSETWFSDCFCDGLDGYKVFHVHRGKRRGGGISIFVRETINAKL